MHIDPNLATMIASAPLSVDPRLGVGINPLRASRARARATIGRSTNFPSKVKAPIPACSAWSAASIRRRARSISSADGEKPSLRRGTTSGECRWRHRSRSLWLPQWLRPVPACRHSRRCCAGARRKERPRPSRHNGSSASACAEPGRRLGAHRRRQVFAAGRKREDPRSRGDRRGVQQSRGVLDQRRKPHRLSVFGLFQRP